MEESHSTTAPSYVPLLQGIRASKSDDGQEYYDAMRQESTVASNAILSPNNFSECFNTVYAQHYNDLLTCYRFLEQENSKLMELIHADSRPDSPPRRIEKLLDEFSFKIATAKDAHERQTIEDGCVAGRQAFLAKRWKSRYYGLLDLTESYRNLLKTKAELERGEFKSSEDVEMLGQINEVLRHLDEVVGPWELDPTTEKTGKEVCVEDLACEGDKTGGHSDYSANDLVIPLSSVFLLDVLSNHRLCAQNIKQHLDTKSQILHVFHKEKERRDQLKLQCSHLKDELNALRKHYGAACLQLKHLQGVSDEDSQTLASTQPRDSEEEIEEFEERSERKSPIKAGRSAEDTREHDRSKVAERIQEIKIALKEEETQLSQVMRRLERVTGTVYAYARLLSDEIQACHVEAIDHNKLLVNYKDCFILDRILKAEESNVVLLNNFRQLINDSIHDGPMTIATLGTGAETLLLSPTDGLALLTVQHLLNHLKSITNCQFLLFAYVLAVGKRGVDDLLHGYPSSDLITKEYADWDFIDGSKSCIPICGAEDFAELLRWFNMNKASEDTRQSTFIVRLVGKNTDKMPPKHSTWLFFYPLFSANERDILGSMFQALKKRCRASAMESPLTNLFQKSLVGKSRTILISNIDFDYDQVKETLANLTFMHEAVKATTELAEHIVARGTTMHMQSCL